MNSLAILRTGGREEINVKNHLETEFLKNGINVIQPTSAEAVQKSDGVILMYDTNEGITSSFEIISRNLINWNIKPIVLVINAQNKDVDYVKIDENISRTWRNINSELYLNTATRFYYENNKQIAYQVKTGEEQGISELIDEIKCIKYKMKFFEN